MSVIPYDVRLLAGNTAGCGPIPQPHLFFTKEGGIYARPDKTLSINYPIVPSAPRDENVERLPSGTAMNVSFTRLTIVEAHSLNVSYTVVYSLTPIPMRPSNMKRVPDNASHVVIGGLDPSATYHVIVVANNTVGKTNSSQMTLLPGTVSLFFFT